MVQKLVLGHGGAVAMRIDVDTDKLEPLWEDMRFSRLSDRFWD